MRVDFAFDAHDRIAQAVRTTAKQVTRANRLVVYCTDASRMSRYDTALWSLPGTLFIAHEPFDDKALPDLPVYLIQDPQSCHKVQHLLKEGYWLLNLEDECPPLPEPAGRILEIVSAHEQDRALARVRWRDYREAGYQLYAHQLQDG